MRWKIIKPWNRKTLYFKYSFIIAFILSLVETIHNFEWGETNVLQTRSKSFSVSSCHELVLFILLVSLRHPLLRPRFHFKQVRNWCPVYLKGSKSFTSNYELLLKSNVAMINLFFQCHRSNAFHGSHVCSKIVRLHQSCPLHSPKCSSKFLGIWLIDILFSRNNSWSLLIEL